MFTKSCFYVDKFGPKFPPFFPCGLSALSCAILIRLLQCNASVEFSMPYASLLRQLRALFHPSYAVRSSIGTVVCVYAFDAVVVHVH